MSIISPQLVDNNCNKNRNLFICKRWDATRKCGISLRKFSKPMLNVTLQYLVIEYKFFPAEHNFRTLNNCKYCRITLHFSHHIGCFSPKATINITLGLLHFICVLILQYCAVKSGRIVNLNLCRRFICH